MANVMVVELTSPSANMLMGVYGVFSQILMVMLQAPLSQEVPNERRSDSPT